MDRRGLWALLNVINVLATGGVAWSWWLRRAAAVAALAGPGGPDSRRRQLRRNRDYATGMLVINGGLCLLGAALLAVAAAWRGPVPAFVVGGTGAFAALWLCWAGLAALDWRWLAEVAALVERERHEGC